MKRCPLCNRVETDDALAFCRADGAALISESGAISGDASTVKFDSAPVSNEIAHDARDRDWVRASVQNRER